MNNYVQPGHRVEVAMPDAKTSGDGVLVGTALFGVAVETYSSAESGIIQTQGVFDLAKTTGQAYAAGARLYWNNTTSKLTTTTGGHLQVGVALEAATSGATTARALLGATAPTLA